MRSMFRNNLSWFLAPLLILSILWLGVFGLIAMNHGVGMHGGCPIDFIGAEGDFQPMGSNFCADVHMGMIQELANAIPGNVDFGLGIASLIAFVALLFVRARDEDAGIYALSRIRYHDRTDKDPHSFFSQIKKWISLCEERDPSYCPPATLCQPATLRVAMLAGVAMRAGLA